MTEMLLEPDQGRRIGPRQARRARARRRRRRFAVGLVLSIAFVGFVVAMLRLQPADVERDDVASVPAAQPPAPPDQATLLLVRHAEHDPSQTGVTLLAAGPTQDDAAVVFLPSGTLLDLPGIGTDRLGLAYQYGGAPLVEASVENALGVAIDHTATVSDSGLAALLERTGGLRLDVPERVVRRHPDGHGEVRFEPGEQVLDGPRLAEYWNIQQREDDELNAFARQQLVLQRLFDEFAARPQLLDELVGDGAPQLSTAAPAPWLRELFESLTRSRQAGQLDFTILPVEPFGAAVGETGPTYRVREDALESFVSSALRASASERGAEGLLRVQILNGVGVPGVGQQVGQRLEGAGFRIVLTENARSFDFAETRILVYDESPHALAAAQRLRERLGVGTIQVSRQAQTVVDLTVVVGADFLSSDGGSDEAATEEPLR